MTLGSPHWSDDGAKLVFGGRSDDFKDRWIFAAEPASGALRSIFSLHDDAWAGGPGGSILGWLPDNEKVYFIAERSG